MDRFPQWREVLQIAPDVQTVKTVMRDYVASLSPLLGVLPDSCRHALEGEGGELDIQAAAVALLQEELTYSGSEEGRVLLHEIAYTFASAAVRITLLYSRPAPSLA